MERFEWDERVGTRTVTLVDQLEYDLFIARCCLEGQRCAMDEDAGDREMLDIWHRKVRDIRTALAALYQKMEG